MSMNNRTRRALQALETDSPSHWFTVARAEKSLILVRRVVSDIVAHFNRLLQLQDEMEAAQRSRQNRLYADSREQIRAAFGRLQQCRREIEQIGGILKDWGKGIVHFPCHAHGREVYLCWRFNEPHIGHWHEVGGCGYDRRPIGTLVGLGQYAATPRDSDPVGHPARHA